MPLPAHEGGGSFIDRWNRILASGGFPRTTGIRPLQADAEGVITEVAFRSELE